MGQEQVHTPALPLLVHGAGAHTCLLSADTLLSVKQLEPAVDKGEVKALPDLEDSWRKPPPLLL